MNIKVKQNGLLKIHSKWGTAASWKSVRQNGWAVYIPKEKERDPKFPSVKEGFSECILSFVFGDDW